MRKLRVEGEFKIKPCFLPTAIGSVPHINPERACDLIFDNFKELPFWPQLPKLSFNENMYVQFSENIPARKIDKKGEKIYFELENISIEAERFYEEYISENLDYFEISPDYARGFFGFKDKLKDEQLISKAIGLKGQITGPISFGLAVFDKNKKPILYDELFLDILVKALAKKASWQVKELKKLKRDGEILIFIDEPYLMSFGSAFVSLEREKVISLLREVTSSLDCITGVHCCGNTDWSLFPEAGVDIISFDAYDYTENLALYAGELREFLTKGGILAWGIVPTSFPNPEQIDKEDLEGLITRLEEKVELLAAKGIDFELLFQQGIVTPNCGAGSLTEEKTEKIFNLTRNISDRFREKYQQYIV